ncbi:MAG: hypothetical protein VX294_11830 [Candidatus Latescibacterota bacterium]|nr:hypothetical protein [Candidatus Latescibacterota bacterium]
MRHIVVAAVVLLLGAMGPQKGIESSMDPLWFIGVLLLVAYSFGRLLDSFDLPSTVGWFLAGLTVGETGLQLVLPKEFAVLNLLRDATLAWIVFHIGLNCYPISWLNKRISLSIFFSTISVVILVSFSVWFVVGLSWQPALFIGAVSAFWGPFSGMPVSRRLFAVEIGGVGGLFSLLLFLLTLQYLSSIAWLAHEAETYVGRIIFSMSLGGIGGYIICRFDLWPRTLKGLLSGMLGVCLLIAAAFQTLNLYVLPFVVTASLVVSREKRWKRKLNRILNSVGIFPYLLYFGLMGSFLNLRIITEPIVGVMTALGIAALTIFVFRGIWVSAMFRAQSLPQNGKFGLDVLSRGVLTFEICMPTGLGLFDSITGQNAKLLMQFVTLDIFLSLVFYAIFIRFAQIALRARRLRNN